MKRKEKTGLKLELEHYTKTKLFFAFAFTLFSFQNCFENLDV